MRLFLLTSLTMLAFAMNSILARAAVDGAHADPGSFAVLRVAAGVVVLVLILGWKARQLPEMRAPRRWAGGLALAVYMIGFSFAYLSLDAGLGALILFGTVQIALFFHSALTSQRPTGLQISGAGVAFLGLSLVLWPDPNATSSWLGAVQMVLAGLGWAAYTVAGRSAPDPLAATASHFLLCLPFMGLMFFAMQSSEFTGTGILLALVSGGITSGLGYSLWYHVLPGLPGARAAVVQLSVPVLAILLGALLLAEPISGRVLISSLLVVGGIALALIAPKAPEGRS